jgi:hypothetical protein
MAAPEAPWDDLSMEHRWGHRLRVDIPVRISAHPFSVRSGRLCDLSVSGAAIEGVYELRLLSQIQVALDLHLRSRHDAPTVSAYVARKYKDGVGIEWCEFAPPDITSLLKAFTARRHTRLRRPEPAAAIAISRLHTPLLKHGTG